MFSHIFSFAMSFQNDKKITKTLKELKISFSPKASKLIKQIGKKIQEATGEKLSTFYLKQRISIAIQKGNAVCVRGCHKKEKGSPGLEGLFNFHVQEAVML